MGSKDLEMSLIKVPYALGKLQVQPVFLRAARAQSEPTQ